MRMKRLLTFLTLLTVFIGVGWADEVTYTFGSNGYDIQSISTFTDGDFTISFGGSWNIQNAQFRPDQNASITFNYSKGVIKKLVFTASSDPYQLTVDGTTVTDGTNAIGSMTSPGTWEYSTGSSTVVVTNTTTQRRLKSVTITYEEGGSQTTTHIVTLNQTTGGTIATQGNIEEASEGSTVHLIATPDEHYTFTSWSVYKTGDETTTVAVTDDQFIMPAYDVTVTATFTAKRTYYITVTGVTCDPAAPESAYAGDVVTLHPSIPEDKVVDWTATTVTPSTLEINHSDYSFTMPEADVSIAFVLMDKPNTVEATFIFNTAAGLTNLGIYVPQTPSSGTQISGITYKSGDVSFIATNGDQTNTQVFFSSQEKLDLRVYTGGTFTISVPEGSNITSIAFTSEDGDRAASSTTLNVNSGSMGNNIWTATSNVSTVTFSAISQVRIYTITVSYIAGEAPDVVEYYLAGDMNGWGNPVDPAYKFVEQQDGSYVLEKELPDMANTENIRFKIAKVVNGGTPELYGGSGNGDYGLNRKWNNINDIVLGNDGSHQQAFSMPDCFNAIFTLNADDMTFSVEKPQLFMIGTFNSYATPNSSANGALEMTADTENGGWTLTGTFTDGAEFRLYDAWHVHHGGDGFWILEEYLGTERNIINDNQSIFRIVGDGEYIITVNDDITKLVAERIPEKYTATIASGITGGSVSFNENSQVSTLNNLTEGYVVRVYVTPTNEHYALATLTYTAEGSSEAVEITQTDGVYSFAMPAANVTINATFTWEGGEITTTTYRRITSTDDLEPGKRYLIVNEENSRAELSGTENSTTITITNHETTVSSDSEIGQFVLGGDANGYTFYSGGKYISNSNNSSNSFVSTLSDNCYWTITFTEPDADDNVYATIKTKNYNRIFYYFGSTGGYFRAYSANNYSSNVQLYKEVTEETPEEVTLAELCAKDENEAVNKTYTISDELVAVAATLTTTNSGFRVLLFCKDHGPAIDAVTNTNDYIDYMKVNGGFEGEWDQSNWVTLSFPSYNSENPVPVEIQDKVIDLLNNAQEYVGWRIKEGSITGRYANWEEERDFFRASPILVIDVDYDNPVIPFEKNGTLAYSPNLYSPANFYEPNLGAEGAIGTSPTTDEPINYFFMKPKINEVCEVTYAVWNEEGWPGGCFTLPQPNGTMNNTNIPGVVKADMRYNQLYVNDNNELAFADPREKMVQGQAYKFKAVVRYEPSPIRGLKDEPQDTGGLFLNDYSYTVYPIDFDPENDDNIVTSIDNVNAFTGSDVKGIKYVNVAGVVSDKPFSGMNIVVIEYTNGTKSTYKMISK